MAERGRPRARGNKVRALAVTGAKRSPLFPDLPTVAEAGLPGYEAVLHYGIVAPAGTPRPIVEKLNAALNAALAERRGEAAGLRSTAPSRCRRRPERVRRRHRPRGGQVVGDHPASARLKAEVTHVAPRAPGDARVSAMNFDFTEEQKLFAELGAPLRAGASGEGRAQARARSALSVRRRQADERAGADGHHHPRGRRRPGRLADGRGDRHRADRRGLPAQRRRGAVRQFRPDPHLRRIRHATIRRRNG